MFRLHCLTYALAFGMALGATLSFISCKRLTNYVESIGEEPPFSVYQDSLNTDRMKHYLSELVRNDTSHWKADFAVKHRYDSIADFSKVPVWFSDEGLSPDADEVLEYLRHELPNNALSTDAFNIPQIEEDLGVVHALAFDSLGLDINQVLMRLDYNLSKAYTRYVTGMRYGFVRPSSLYNRLYKKDDNSGFAYLYDYDTLEPNYDETISKLTADERVDYLKASEAANGRVYKALQAELVSAADADARSKIKVNMERCRWRIKHPSYNGCEIIVNIPSQQLWAMRADTILDMKICCGAWNTKTPLLCSEIGYMQVNPEWSIPPKIVDSDFPRHAGDSSWFARHRYFAVDRSTGDTVKISHITSEGFKNHRLRIVQRGGQGNSLGRIVFRFANKFSIYLHDTNSRGVFSRDRRTVSHGCVRVEKPYELALFLLPGVDEWTEESLRISMDIPPLTERGQKWVAKHANDPHPFKLLSYHKVSPKVPVYIIYYTAYPNPSTGIMEYFPDLYGYDAPLHNALLGILE